MGKKRDWENEVREILRAGGSAERTPPAVGILDRLGRFVLDRISSPRQLATTGAVLIVISLFLALFPFMRLIVPISATAGVLMLFFAYISILGRGRTGGSRRSGKMWRGRTIDDRPEPGRLASWFDRWRRR